MVNWLNGLSEFWQWLIGTLIGSALVIVPMVIFQLYRARRDRAEW